MKKVIGWVALLVMSGMVFAEEMAAPATPAAPATEQAQSATTDAKKADANKNGENGSTDASGSIRTYWNKFIDIFTGPSEKTK